MIDDERRYQQFAGHRDIGQHAQTFQPISGARVGRYTDEFDAETLGHITDLAREGLEAFGYE